MLPFLPGLEGSEAASLTSDTLSRRSPFDRCWNLTLRRDLDMMGGKGERGDSRRVEEQLKEDGVK